MIEEEKYGFGRMIKDGLRGIAQTISNSIFQPINESTGLIMKNIENKIIQIEKRIFRKIFSLGIIILGVLLLASALFFFMIEYLNWSITLSFFSMAVAVLVIGLILKLTESNR